jgi:hypothetical protein
MLARRSASNHPGSPATRRRQPRNGTREQPVITRLLDRAQETDILGVGSNPPGEIHIERFGWTFCPGDKVMQVENDYDK